MSSVVDDILTEEDETLQGDLVKSGSVNDLDVRRQSMSPHTLELYASSHFRRGATIGRRSLRRTFSGQIHQRQQRSGRNNLWRFSLDPIQSPLLKKTPDELQYKACQCFKYIMKYMGDYPTRKSNSKTTLTDSIFQLPLSHAELCDEVYCQIVKQITQNRKRSSEERGWELLWFSSGLFPPSDPDLYNELDLFFQSHKDHWPVASDIHDRLSSLSKVSGYRLCPPHATEVDAIQNKLQNLYQKVLIPDESSQVIHIHSLIKCHEICSKLAELLNLKSSEGFGLVLIMENDVIASYNDEYFMDFLYESTKHISSHDSDTDALYQVVFVKTHFVNVTVGQDHGADITFHYPQELAKYINGCYKVTADEAAQIGSYIYRAKYGSTPFHLDSFKSMILDLVPMQCYTEYAFVNWEEEILGKYRQHSISSSNEAKLSFLKCLSRWPTYASHFFEVTQYLALGSNRNRTLVINQSYVLILDSSNDIIESHSLSSIASWSYSVKANQLKLSLKTGETMSFVTALYYEISQLLIYYSNYASTNKDKIHTKHRISILCDSIA